MSVLDAARAWRDQDPDAETRAELDALIGAAEAGDPGARHEIDERFASRLAFGTAGLRGALGAGPNRMNRVLVAQAAAGLAAYLRARHEARPLVVIGYDGRRNSAVFGRDSAEVLAGAGLRVVLLPRPLPTPVLAFAVRHLGADAGVMVTASHNPPGDNGYKVYLGGADGGSQIVPPADAGIAAQIDRVAAGDIRDLPRSDRYELAPETVVEAYVAATAAVAPAPPGASGLRWVYTALHGVGWETFAHVLDRAGYPPPVAVDDQLHPDAAFPTVAFPNPEEPGTLERAFAAARAAAAELVIAHDPDADRLAVAIPDGSGGFRALTGNQLGLLLGWRAARLAAASGTPDASLACSLVSSPALAAVAARYGLGFHTTLTGFKWISRTPGLVYGFEEALGYLVNPDTVRDKDGLSAAVAILGLVAEARGVGRSLADLLDEFDRAFGVFASGQVSVRLADAAAVAALMSALRARRPAALGGVPVDRVDDLLEGIDALPPGDVLRLWLRDGSRVLVRPSGTEPKLKLYLDVQAETAETASARLAALTAAARALLDSL
ncbi:MAG: phospho-sugar mutase [Microbacterium sp.]